MPSKKITDPDQFLQQALRQFYNANWHRAALMFNSIHEHIKAGGELPRDWRWNIRSEYEQMARREANIARKVGFLIGHTGIKHVASCVEPHGPRLLCEGHELPQCIEETCELLALYMSEDMPRCEHHYGAWSGRVSRMMGYGGPSRKYTGD